MIMDERTEFCDATAIGGSTGARLVGDVVDLGADQRSLGDGHQLYLVINVAVTATSAGSATVSFALASDAQAAIAVDGSETTHVVTESIAVADLAAGYRRVIPVPPESSVPYERYVGIVANVGTAALTAGSIDAFLTMDPPGWKAYADAVN